MMHGQKNIKLWHNQYTAMVYNPFLILYHRKLTVNRWVE